METNTKPLHTFTDVLWLRILLRFLFIAIVYYDLLLKFVQHTLEKYTVSYKRCVYCFLFPINTISFTRMNSKFISNLTFQCTGWNNLWGAQCEQVRLGIMASFFPRIKYKFFTGTKYLYKYSRRNFYNFGDSSKKKKREDKPWMLQTWNIDEWWIKFCWNSMYVKLPSECNFWQCREQKFPFLLAKTVMVSCNRNSNHSRLESFLIFHFQVGTSHENVYNRINI